MIRRKCMPKIIELKRIQDKIKDSFFQYREKLKIPSGLKEGEEMEEDSGEREGLQA